MYFIYEEDNLSVAVHDFFDHSLETFLKFALILGARDKRTHVKGEDLAVLEVLRHLSVDDLCGDAFGNCRLSHTRLTYENRIVLRAPAQNLQHAADLLISTDHRIEFSVCRSLIEVYGILA